VFRAQQWDNVQTITTNSWTTLLFDQYSNPNTSVFDFDVVGSDLTGVILFSQGLVTVNVQWQWVGSWTATEQGMWCDDAVNVWAAAAAVMPRLHTTSDYTMSMTRSYPAFEFQTGSGGNAQPRFDFRCLQNSGSDRDIQARFEVVYWGPMTVGDYP